jgi:hypothetical protein
LDDFDKRPSRLAALPLALIFLFETWVWDKLVALARVVAARLPWAQFRDASRRVVNRLPAIFAVLMFGVPLLVAEGGSFVSVVIMATGHVFMGMALYAGMKLFGLLLVPVIFEITREKLLGLAWFAWSYEKFEWLHAAVRRFVAPYKEAAKQWARDLVAPARAAWRALFYGAPRSADNASAAKSDTRSSSARAVPANPASPSH